MKTLIVENEPLIRLDRWYQMQLLGFECLSCSNAAMALAVCCQAFYPLMITDMGLPDMDGLKLCRRVRELPHGPKMAILVVSARDAFQDIRAAIKAGADDFLSKPASPKQLAERVHVLRYRVLWGNDTVV